MTPPVNAQPVTMEVLQPGPRTPTVFHMELPKAKKIMGTFVLMFSIAAFLWLLFSGGYFVIGLIGIIISFFVGLVFVIHKDPELWECVTYLVITGVVYGLYIFVEIMYLCNEYYVGLIIGSVILAVCYTFVMIAQIKVVVFLIKDIQMKNRLGRGVDTVRVERGAPIRPRPPQPMVPVPSGAPVSRPMSPVTTTTVITTYNATPGQPVIIPPGIPAIHGLPPGPLNPANLASNQVAYTSNTPIMYPAVSPAGQMAVATLPSAPMSENAVPSAPPHQYDYVPEVTVEAVRYQNAANESEHYDLPPGLVEEYDQPPTECSPSPSISMEYYDIPPTEKHESQSEQTPDEQGSTKDAPRPLPRKTRPSADEAPPIDLYEAPPTEDDETPIMD